MDAKFGMFIHFGLYTLLGRNENAVRGGPKSEYAKIMKDFNPVKFDADEWVKLAVDAGAKYIVPTAKHAEGFCLWNTKLSRYNVMNTPFKRDIILELAEACAKHNIRLGLYVNINTWLSEKDYTAKTYYDFFSGQISELMSNYGKISSVWFDHQDDLLPLESVKKIVEYIHKKQPECVVNDRGIELSGECLPFGDYLSPESFIPEYIDEQHLPFECCDSICKNSWGYDQERHYWSSRELIRRFSKAFSLGGNYLLNIAPMPDGQIDHEQVSRMHDIGRWVKYAGNNFFKTQPCDLEVMDPATLEYKKIGVVTKNKNSYYLHLHTWPACSDVCVPNVSGDVKKIQLAGYSEALTSDIVTREVNKNSIDQPSGLFIHGLPANPVNPWINIIRVDFKAEPVIDTAAINKSKNKVVKFLSRESAYLKAETGIFKAEGGIPWHEINRFYNGNTSIGHIIRYGCQVIWNIDVEKSATYDVYIDLGTISLQAGASYSITAGKSSVSGITEENGPYDKYKRYYLGKMKINKGRQEVVFKVDKLKGTFSDIHNIVFIPA